MYFTPAVLSRVGVSLLAVITRPISAFERIPDCPVHSPAVPPEENGHPGVLQDGSAKVNERP